MPRRLINSRAERIAREHDDAAQWLAVHDAARIAAEHEARRAAWRLAEPRPGARSSVEGAISPVFLTVLRISNTDTGRTLASRAWERS